MRSKLFSLLKSVLLLELGGVLLLVYQMTTHTYPLGTESFFAEYFSQTTKTENTDNLQKLEHNLAELQKENDKLQKQVASLNNQIDTLKAITPPSDKQLTQIINQTPKAIAQGLDPKQLRPMVETVLSYLGEKDQKWIDLLLITGQVESDLGRLVKQVKGPAVGLFQIEPFTEGEVWKHYISRNKDLKEKITKLRFPAKLGRHEMEYNTAYSIALTYCIYKWRKVNPKDMTLAEMATTHKVKYNTMKGKSSVSKTIQKLAGTKVL